MQKEDLNSDYYNVLEIKRLETLITHNIAIINSQ